MGTHPIFESDFDCLTEKAKMDDLDAGAQSRPAMSSGMVVAHYELGDTIGSGSFGKVKKAKHKKTGHEVAVKILNRNKIKSLEVVNKTKREIENALRFRHPHIIKMYQVYSSTTDLFLVMEYVPNGELFDYICNKGKLDEKEARTFFQQIISGVDCCHRSKVVHRDLKPENLLLDKNNNVRIADFGLSNILNDGEFLKTSCGSPNYAAPEVICGKLYAGPEVDVWSSGVILYALLCGTLPFDDDNTNKLFQKIKRGVYETPEHIKHSSVSNLISQMLTVNPVERATIGDVIKHPWFQVDLPKNLFPDPGSKPNDQILNHGACNEVASKFGVSIDTVKESVEAHLSNPATATAQNPNSPSDQYSVAYQLTIDNMNLQSKAPDFYSAPRKPSLGGTTAGFREKPHPERMAQLLDSGPADVVGQQKDVQKEKPRTVRPKQKWHLGIRSTSDHKHVMKEVYKALSDLGFQWKNISYFKLRVRVINKNNPDRYDKMNITLYKSPRWSDKNPDYLLDFTSCPLETNDDNFDWGATHSTMNFFEMCSQIINKLANN